MKKNSSCILQKLCFQKSPASKEKELLKKLKRGFANEEFKVYLQFIVDGQTGKPSSAEALSRWETAEGKVIFPGEYIGLLEESGMITDFDYYMFERACAVLSRWKGTELSELSLSCNFTRLTISETDFADRIGEISERFDFEREKLILEITEDSVEKDLAVAKENIHKVKKMGFRIALDDIGSGYTSLISLCDYPVDLVKIDRSVLLKTVEEKGKKLFEGILSLAHSLNLKAVCEGVETEEQNTLVSQSGCDYIQGWYHSKALAFAEAETFAKNHFKR